MALIEEARPWAGSVAEVVLIPELMALIVVPAAGRKVTAPVTSQSPAVSDSLVQFAAVLLAREVPVVLFG